MKKSEFEITAYYEVEGDLWWEGKATREDTRHYTHDKDQFSYSGAPKIIKSLKDLLIDIIQEETGDFQRGSVKIMWLMLDVQYRHTAGDKIMRTKIFTFEPDQNRYPDYFVEA